MKLKKKKLLDTTLEISAPEFTVFHNRLAGPSIRFFAVFLDHCIFFVLILLLFMLLVLFSIANMFSYMSSAKGAAFFVFFILLFLVYWFYFFMQEYFLRGRTLGKIITGLRVISIDGTSLDFFQIWLRNLLRFADMFPVKAGFFPSYFVGLVSIFADPLAFRRLGDLAAGTIVVRETRGQHVEVVVSKSSRIIELAAQLEIKYQPSPVLTRAINEYAIRVSHLHQNRAQEIAARVEAQLRVIFGARQLECSAQEILLAAHLFLHGLDQPRLSRFNIANPGSPMQ